MEIVYEIRHYVTLSGKDVYLDWLSKLRDTKAKLAIVRRLDRAELGNLGDHKFLRDGVFEFRISVGPGYRVYYALDGDKIVLLLCGGDKSSQVSDISRACEYWREWQERSDD